MPVTGGVKPGRDSDKVPRVDRVNGPLVVGQFYLVPTVHGQWFAQTRDWPVIGPEHNDREFFAFTTWHYHIDARFLPRGDKRCYDTLTYPLHGRHAPTGNRYLSLPKPVWKRRRCLQAGLDFNPGGKMIGALREHYAGVQCAHKAGGFVCPHKGTLLGSILPHDGVITCPLHGLRIDATTGAVLSAGVR